MEESSRAFFPRLLCSLSCLLAALAAQNSADVAFLAVGDLVHPEPGAEPYLTKLPMLGARVVRGEESWLSRGFESLYTHRRELPFVDGEGVGWFSGDALEAVLTDLVPELVGKIAVDEGAGTLRVPSGLAGPARALLAELRASLPPTVQIELEVSRGGVGLLGRSASVRAGRRTWISTVVEGAAVADYEVELAQSAFTGNPVPLASDTGAMVVLRPTVAPGAAEGWFEVLVRLVDPGQDARFESGETSCGSIDRVHQVVREFAAVVPVRLGVPVVQRWSGPGGEAIELRLVPNWQVQVDSPIAGHDVQYESPWPTARGFRCTGAHWPQPEGDSPSLPDVDFANELERVGRPGREVGPFQTARFGIDAEAIALRGATRSRLQRFAPVTVRCELFEAPVGAKPDAEGRLPDARELAKAEVTTVRDTWACVAAYDELTVVLDWDLEVAQSSRIADPKPTRLAYGWFLDLKCSDTQIEIVGELSQRLALDARATRLSIPLLVPGPAGTSAASGDSAERASILPGETVRIDAPRISRQPVAGTLPLRRAEPAIWRARSSSVPPGREIVLLVRRVD